MPTEAPPLMKHMFLEDRHLMRIMAALALTGAASVMRSIIFPLFATTDVHLSISQFGLLAGVTVACSIALNIIVGRLSDRLRRRRLLILASCLWLGLGYLLCALRPSAALLFVVGAGFFSFITVPIGQLFATGSEGIKRRAYPRPKMMMGALRATFSLGFASGPLLAAAITSWAGLRAGILLAAVPWILAAVVMAFDTSSRDLAPSASKTTQPWAASTLLFFAAFCLMSLVDVTRVGFLAVYARKTLQIPLGQVGLLFSITSICNLALMPLAGALADRWGAHRIVLFGAAVGTVGAFGTAAATSFAALCVFSVCHSVYSTGIYSVGLAAAQELSEGRPGFGIGVYNSALQSGSLLGMLFGGMLVERAGWTVLFLTAGLSCLCGMFVLTRLQVSPGAVAEPRKAIA